MSIFQSRAWRLNWWRQWGDTPGFTRIAPWGDGFLDSVPWLYMDSYRLRRVLPIRCLQLVGSNYRRISTPRSEYGDLPANGEGLSAYRRILQPLAQSGFSEAVFSDLVEGGDFHDALRQWAEENHYYVRPVYEDRAYSVNTSGDFDGYLASLGKNTRLKFYNRRKVISGLGEVCLRNAWSGDVSGFFDVLNGFHRDRWGADCFSERSLRFHLGFLNDLVSEGGEPVLSRLEVDGKLVSVLYNVAFKGTLYNIQSGFLEQFHPKISLGLLHLGYAIEEAFGRDDILSFDLLAGRGKNTDYKRHIATDVLNMISLMIVRAPLAKLAYRLKDVMTSNQRK